ncbi:hypothetical protein [Burkholderia ubonensis]|uniref:hypothetical protein n=1 Tax=Burkholderia ubonensis TaxID=101571 RepID=UPI0018DEFB3D|nr:hypothetical protein [Burkholderia ubonensis]
MPKPAVAGHARHERAASVELNRDADFLTDQGLRGHELFRFPRGQRQVGDGRQFQRVAIQLAELVGADEAPRGQHRPAAPGRQRGTRYGQYVAQTGHFAALLDFHQRLVRGWKVVLLPCPEMMCNY